MLIFAGVAHHLANFICQLQSRAKVTKYPKCILTQHKDSNCPAFPHNPCPLYYIEGKGCPIVYFLSPRKDAFCEPPRRQDVWKTHTTTEVCLTDTYTGSGLENYPLSSSDPKCVPSKNETEMQAQRQRSYASSILRSACAFTAVTSQRGTKGKGGQARWKILMEL